MENKTYISIDLKSFFASVECVARGLDPLRTNLVVADSSRTEKTICLAVTPSLKSYGIAGRARMFEVVQRVRDVNRERVAKAPGRRFSGSSCDDGELKADPGLAVDYIVAKPRMALYKNTSVEIYRLYLKYVAPEDIHVYSVDEVFIDATKYLAMYKMTAVEFTRTLILDVLSTTGITATAGIGTNLYLCKVAMDIMAKHVKPDENGVRIAELDELRKQQQRSDYQAVNDRKSDIRRRLNEAETALHQRDEDTEPVPAPTRPIAVGDTVELAGVRTGAAVLAVNGDGTLLLQAGKMKMTVKAAQVRLLETAEEIEKKKKQSAAAQQRSGPAVSINTGARASAELDIRGLETLEAESVVENYLDAASRSKLGTVTIIHGKGTGALRAAVHQLLKKNKQVKSFRLGRYGEGEAGVTVVELK